MPDASMTADTQELAPIPLPSVGRTIDPGFMLESLVSDFQWTALAVGTITHILNAWVQAETEWTPRSCRHLLHDDHQVMLLSLRFAADMGLPSDAAAAIREFHEGLAKAKERCAPLIQQASLEGRSERHRLRDLAATWKGFSRLASTLLGRLQSNVGAQLPRAYELNARLLATFLDEAVQGRTDRVDASGHIKLPDLVQRRHAVRLPVDMPCRVLHPAGSWAATLKDVSRTGLRFNCIAPLQEQQRLTIELPDHRRLNGTVAWKEGDLYGLALTSHLSSRDSLIMHAKG